MLVHGVLFRFVVSSSRLSIQLTAGRAIHVLQPPRKNTTSQGASDDEDDEQDLDERYLATHVHVELLLRLFKALVV